MSLWECIICGNVLCLYGMYCVWECAVSVWEYDVSYAMGVLCFYGGVLSLWDVLCLWKCAVSLIEFILSLSWPMRMCIVSGNALCLYGNVLCL